MLQVSQGEEVKIVFDQYLSWQVAKILNLQFLLQWIGNQSSGCNGEFWIASQPFPLQQNYLKAFLWDHLVSADYTIHDRSKFTDGCIPFDVPSQCRIWPVWTLRVTSRLLFLHLSARTWEEPVGGKSQILDTRRSSKATKLCLWHYDCVFSRLSPAMCHSSF